MSSTVIRTVSHALNTSPEVRNDVARTVTAYRRGVRALCMVLMTHWPELATSKNKCQAVEALFHATAKRPVVRYRVLDRMLGKMPSYLRRAAIEAAWGLVSSFQSNWSNFLDGHIGGREREQGARSPRIGIPKVFPTLYGGNMLLVGQGLKTVQVKLLGADGQWRFTTPLRLTGRLKRLSSGMRLSPTLMQRGAKVWLSCPADASKPKLTQNKNIQRVCALDVNVKTAVCAAIVDTSGTVIARKFLTCGRHNDRRDEVSARIARKQAQSHGVVGRRLGRAFCQTLYRRIAGLSLQAARELAAEVMAFARAHGAKALVLESLKGFRPKGRGKAQKKRFHLFQHRMLRKYLGFAAEEQGLGVLEVHPGGTSRWAYDGSGKVVRDAMNAALATFASGKRYNADLNAAYNIAARGLALMLSVKKQKAPPGKSPVGAVRMPLVLADIWAHAQVKAAAL